MQQIQAGRSFGFTLEKKRESNTFNSVAKNVLSPLLPGSESGIQSNIRYRIRGPMLRSAAESESRPYSESRPWLLTGIW